MPDGYTLHDGPPAIDDYRRLRAESGLTPKSHEQAVAGRDGAWDACHVVDDATGETVGMGRTLGDGGWYFHIVDVAVLPAHQRRGLGDAIMSRLVGRIRRDAPPGAWITLLADAPGRRLYERHGFVDTAPRSVGMAIPVPPA